MDRNNRSLWIVLAVLVGIVLLGPLLGGGMMAAGMMGPGMMGGSGMMDGPGGPAAQGAGGWGWGWGLAVVLGTLAMLAFWGAVIIAIVLAVRAFTGSGGDGVGTREDAALDILKRRYAAGELMKEQYEEMRPVLQR